MSYYLYLKDRNKRYHYGIKYSDVGSAFSSAFSLSRYVPFVMLTNAQDASVFESEKGTIVWPDDSDKVDPSIFLYYDPSSIISDKEDLKNTIHWCKSLDYLDPDFRYLEATILAASAIYGFNLDSFGWIRPD